ncbi:MAG: 2-oxoacid:acceptor oxidoreductase subunit alpha [Candidatus Micrarchaeota archaeon]|nr:2-oxoacid:acceptor oxidoreductase subunit alpha [Candidatus Micrarchaeota archaeon]
MSTKLENIVVKFGGEAGEGLMTAGFIAAKYFQRTGLFVFAENDYPSLIRGGHNTFTVRANTEKIYALDGKVDILIALDKRSVLEHINELSANSVVIFDKKLEGELSQIFTNKNIYPVPVPLTQHSAELGDLIYSNQIAIGSLIGLIGGKLEILSTILKEKFSSKKEEILEKNLAAATFGYDFVKMHFKEPFELPIKEQKKNYYLLDGNDAVCLASIKAGVKLVAEYPMSPSSSILHWMAAHSQDYGIVVKQTEDEIAAINYVLGAAYAGVRAMTATSGGGFSLMTEALGNAGLAEIPCVIVEVQRAGPSTGLPTYTDQADLLFVINASQGEFPRIVCMPGDPAEAFYETFNVWNMAELVQTPAIILLDKYLGESFQTVEIKTDNLVVKRGLLQTDQEMENAKQFLRHKITPSGISPRSIPGQKNGLYVASSYEHDESGYSSEDPLNRVMQIDKRARKLSAINPQLYQPVFFGPATAPLLVVSWGSSKGVILEALKHLNRQNIPIRYMHIKYAIPFATDTVKEALVSASKSIIFEGNSTAQMRSYIRQKTGILIENVCLKYDARPFQVEQVVNEIKKLYQSQ